MTPQLHLAAVTTRACINALAAPQVGRRDQQQSQATTLLAAPGAAQALGLLRDGSAAWLGG
jgi:hypothetical protein